MIDKVVLITGTSSGFGKLTAQSLAKAGYTVYASMRNLSTKNAEKAAQMQNWASSNKCNLKVIDLDVTNQNTIDKALREIMQTEGRIDVLINNAGHGSIGITEDFTLDYVRMQFECNVFGLYNITRSVIPIMKRAGSGLIVTMSSGMGRIILPTISVYSASKFAVEALAEGWRYELAPIGIDSVIVEPGAFPTTNFMEASFAHSPKPSGKINDYGSLKDFGEAFEHNMKEMINSGNAGDPQDVANAVVNLINMPQGSRPLRTVVDKMNEGVLNSLNQTSDEMESHLLQAFQLV